MITEDYVSFEIAKLLKKKGFDEITSKWYLKYKGEYTLVSRGTTEHPDSSIDVPTLQMVMKWLIREYRLYVNVVPSVEGYYWTEKWHSYVEDLNKRYPFGKFLGTFNSSEEAIEAAIKYCLENLV